MRIRSNSLQINRVSNNDIANLLEEYCGCDGIPGDQDSDPEYSNPSSDSSDLSYASENSDRSHQQFGSRTLLWLILLI